MSFCSVYIPVGVPTYHLETAQDQFERSCAMLRGVDPDFVCPDEMLLTLDKLRAYLDGLNPDLIVFQNLTFANAAYMAEVLRRYQCPMLLWTLREPVIDGGRLRLNSLTGAYSAANTLAAFDGRAFNWCFGAPEEESVVSAVKATVEAAKVKKAMRSLTMSAIGHTPQGFGFGRALDSELMNTFGVELESIEARELIDMAKTYTDEECAEYLRDTEKCTCGLDKTPENNRNDHALHASVGYHKGRHFVQGIFSRSFFNPLASDFHTYPENGFLRHTTDYKTNLAWRSEARYTYQTDRLQAIGSLTHTLLSDLLTPNETLISLGTSVTWHQGDFRLTAGANVHHYHISYDNAVNATFFNLKLAPILLLGKGFRLSSVLIYNSKNDAIDQDAHLYASIKVGKDLGKRCHLSADFHDIAGQQDGAPILLRQSFKNRALTIGLSYYPWR